MSLINDMLRDLSDKQSTREGDAIVITDLQTASWEQEKMASFFQYSRLPLILGSAAIFVVLFLFLQMVTNPFKSLDFISSDVIQHPISTELTPVLVNTQVELNQSSLNQSIASEIPLNENAIDLSTTQIQIYQLIDQASRAMTLDRLTSPENDNAFFYYQELLKLEPQNTIAITGMKKITDRYLQMAEISIQKNDVTKAEFFVDKASRVTPDDIRIVNFQNQLAEANNQSLGTVNQDRIAVEPDSVTVIDSFENKVDSHLRRNDEVSANNPSLSITPNPEFLDEQMVKQTRDWVAQGFKSKAIDLLENHIQLYPAPASEQYLLDLYYQDQNLTAMQTLLNSNLTMTTVDQTYYRARISVLQNDNPSAITLLESELSQAAANENYRALLAGLYQREQLYTQATSAYRNLLQSFKPKPAYWLGLALSLDAQNQSAAAIHAYKKILEFEQLEPQVSEYAQDRIAQLSRDY